MWKKLKNWFLGGGWKKLVLGVTWASFAVFSYSVIKFTVFQLTFQPTIIINVNETPGVDGEKSKDPFLVRNAKGEDVKLSIWTLTADYSWAFGYDGTNAENKPARLNDLYAALPLSQQQKDGLNSADEIICIGASSQEFKKELINPQAGRETEEKRASRRAASIVRWIRPELVVPVKEPDSIVIRTLKNLGIMWVIEKFTGPPPRLPQRKPRPLNIGQWGKKLENRKPEETDYQRRVVIILILPNDKGEYVGADDTALINAFQVKANNGEMIYKYILDEYSKTEDKIFDWE